MVGHRFSNMMLGADALWPDILGKSATYYNDADIDRLVWVPRQHSRPACYTSDALGTVRGRQLAGFSHAVRRDAFKRVEYPRSLHGAEDTGFLDSARHLGDLLCARTDGLNAVVERRSDPAGHGWQSARTFDDRHKVDLTMDLASFLA